MDEFEMEVKPLGDKFYVMADGTEACPHCNHENFCPEAFVTKATPEEAAAIEAYQEVHNRETKDGLDMIKKHLDKQSAGSSELLDLTIRRVNGELYNFDPCACSSCKQSFVPKFTNYLVGDKNSAPDSKKSFEADQGGQDRDELKDTSPIGKLSAGLKKAGLTRQNRLNPSDEMTSDELKTAVRDKGSTNRAENLTTLMSRGIKKSGLVKDRRLKG